MKNLAALAVVLAVATAAPAATFTSTIVLPDGNIAVPGEPLAIEVHGILDTAADNDGLVFVSVDITATGPSDILMGDAVLWEPPLDGSMDNFSQPEGYDANYGGTTVGNDLVQSGGAQNTIGNDPNAEPFLPFPSAEFITFDVAHTNQVILQGTLTLAVGVEQGTYTLSLENVLANVLGDGQAPMSFGIYQVEAADGVSGGAVDIEVSICAAPDFMAGAAGISFDNRAFDGFIDARAESTDGVNVDLGLDTFTIVFTTALQNMDGSPLSIDAFSITDTGGAAPSIVSISTDDGQTVTVNLSDHITLQEWTTISVSGRAVCDAALTFQGSMDIGYLPADVDQTGDVSPFDLLRFRQYVNEVSSPDLGVIEDYIDTDRDGGVSPFDLLRFRQLINGVSPATRAWAGEELPAQP